MSLARITLASVVLAGSMVAAPTLSIASLSDGETESVAPTIEQPDVDLRASSAVTRIDPDSPFSMVALTWDVDDAPAAVDVRVLAAEGGWSEWTMLDVAEEPAEPGTLEARVSRPSTEPLWTGPSTALEVRAVDDDGAGTPRLELIDPGVAPQDDDIGQEAPGAANAAVAAPSIVTRQQWGADESLRNCTPRIATSLKAAVVHHTVGSNNYSPADSAAIVRGIYAFHTEGRGWCDVGYNFLVDRWGNVFEGRSGGADSPVIGAHTGGFNTGTMGISMMGTFTSAQPPADMLESVSRVIAWKFDRAGIDAQANVTLASGGNSKFSRGTQVPVRTISGHRDLYATECPGGVAYRGLQALRDRTEDLTATSIVEQAEAVPPADSTPDVDVAVPVVQVSGSADRSSAVVLEGATVAGEMFAFVAPQQGVSGVSFYLDDPQLGSPVQVEGQAPWDLGGTAAGGAALPFDVSGLAAGEHTLTAVVSTSAGQQTVTATFTVAGLQVSGSADRSSAVVLEGATVAGEMFAFVAPQQGVSGVSFYLDDPQLGSPVQVEGQAPWDLGGTAAGGAALPFDVSGLAAGEHTLTAVVSTSAGTQTVTSTFVVEQAEAVPPADSTPDVDVAVPVVQVSGSADRSSAVVLEGATVAGEMFAFVAPQQGVSGVSFYLDDPQLGSPVQVEGQAPWDLGGTAAGGAALPFDVSGLAAGEHTLTAVVSTSAGQQTVTATFTVAGLQVSGSADRSSAVVLEGATVAGEMFAFVAPQQGVSGVSFYLDDPQLGSPVQVEGQAPWDLGGTAAGGAALPFDVSGLAAGEHTLTAVVSTSAGQQTVTATFTVAGLQVSGSADRSSAVVLEGATVAGEMFAFVAPQQGVSGVSFYLDDPQLGSPVQVEGQAPWDLGGTAAGGAALPFDVSGLAAGEHTLTAVVSTSAGQQTVTATFTVTGLPASSPPTVESGAARAIFESAGFTGKALDVALGVAYAESAGFADAVGDYWQIIPSHKVTAGESISSIARTYRTTTSSLASLNGVSGPNYTIYPGQRLWNPTYKQRFDFAGVRRYPTWDDGWVDPIGSPVWGPSVGLFQVRTLHNPLNYGPGSAVRDIDGLRDPAFQARAAFMISKGGTDWSPWSVYRSGAYRQYLGADFEIRTGHPEAERWNLAGTR